MLGQLSCSNRNKIALDEEVIPEVLELLGKNANYAALAILVINRYGKQHTKDWLWERVKEDFKLIIGEGISYSDTDQGPLEIVLSLAEPVVSGKEFAKSD